MGSYADLSLGKLEVAWSKNELLLSHSELFQENCLLSSPYDDSENEAKKEWYELKLELVKDRLELLGYTLEYAKKQFENPSPFSYNANDNPTKQTAFSQYDRPQARRRYAEVADHLGLSQAGDRTAQKIERLLKKFNSVNPKVAAPKNKSTVETICLS